MDRVLRRGFLITAVALVVAPLSPEAQQPTKPRIGYLMFNSAVSGRQVLIAFRQALLELGWNDGQNIIIETRFANGEVEQLPALTRELLMLNVELIVSGSSATTRASKTATTTIPIVMLASADAVGEGFVASLARPGGNLTGVSQVNVQLTGKHLELLKETVPGLAQVAFLWNPATPDRAYELWREGIQEHAFARGETYGFRYIDYYTALMTTRGCLASYPRACAFHTNQSPEISKLAGP